ncbi:hypothetical protein JJQ72_04440 [Paenibacillus sp. F411]|uniref:Uncharacterized protein n=1 Tax=Paenibacillus algicola TaxID=2565926 RepID=A0A4V1G3S5_9BACL|nr:MULTISPECIES: hypothetical protein [Paenibacillus]MBO2943229.1 hypothetical protein [Paenibacillus sp. F411]QCT02214.1 hypothetical protein E6C60_1498 [Paenibacillus algicola]
MSHTVMSKAVIEMVRQSACEEPVFSPVCGCVLQQALLKPCAMLFCYELEV